MASRRRATPVAPDNSFSGAQGSRILRAWQGLYHLFGARVERFDITPDGVTAVNLTVGESYDAKVIAESLVGTDEFPFARLDLYPLYFYAQGEAPADFSSSNELTVWLTKNMKGTAKGRSPKWAKDAIQDYKERIGIAVPRGRPRKNFKIADIGSIDTDVLDNSDLVELEKLQETIANVVSRKAPVEA